MENPPAVSRPELIPAQESDLPDGPDPRVWDERHLVEKARHDPEAFAELYRRHGPAVSRYLRRRIGDPETVQDLVAETFKTAWQTIARYRWRGLPIRAWLFRLATTAVTRWLRQERRHASTPWNEEPAAPSDDPDGQRDVARAALLSLPLAWQTVLSLHYLEGWSVDEVARILGCRPGTVKSRLSRGREAMRQELARKGWTS